MKIDECFVRRFYIDEGFSSSEVLERCCGDNSINMLMRFIVVHNVMLTFNGVLPFLQVSCKHD